jgi:hypothetical protein
MLEKTLCFDESFELFGRCRWLPVMIGGFRVIVVHKRFEYYGASFHSHLSLRA